MEGIAYVMIYLMKGFLPWMGLKGKTKSKKHDLIKGKKLEIPLEKLCRGLPAEFLAYMRYVRKLEFKDKPDYKRIRKMFQNLFTLMGFEMDYSFDWTEMKLGLR